MNTSREVMYKASTNFSVHLQEKLLARHVTLVVCLSVPQNSFETCLADKYHLLGLSTTLDLNAEQVKQHQRRTQPTYAMKKVSDKTSNGE